jgi:hypothetical protein
MSKRFAGSMIAIAAAAAAVVLLLAAARDSGQGEAQKAPGRESPPAPRTADGRVQDVEHIVGKDPRTKYSRASGGK